MFWWVSWYVLMPPHFNIDDLNLENFYFKWIIKNKFFPNQLNWKIDYTYIAADDFHI